MHKHSHGCSGCKHDCLHYCECCQKVYCCKCGQEWGGCTYWYQPYYPYWNTTTATYGLTCDATTDTVTCSHSH